MPCIHIRVLLSSTSYLLEASEVKHKVGIDACSHCALNGVNSAHSAREVINPKQKAELAFIYQMNASRNINEIDHRC